MCDCGLTGWARAHSIKACYMYVELKMSFLSLGCVILESILCKKNNLKQRTVLFCCLPAKKR